MKNQAKTLEISIAVIAALSNKMNLTPASLKPRRPKGGIRSINKALEDENPGVFALTATSVDAQERVPSSEGMFWWGKLFTLRRRRVCRCGYC
jgi:hypothetical protein